jgi:hypothetical protein
MDPHLIGTFIIIGAFWFLLRFEPWRWLVPFLRAWRQHG